MARLTLLAGTVALVFGLVILVFAEGLRRYYSGLFFLLMGAVLLWKYRSMRNPAS